MVSKVRGGLMDRAPLEKCPRCFAELMEAWQFCPSCGLPLDPAQSADAGISSPNISYVERPEPPPARHRPSLGESLVQSALHLLVLLAFVGVVTGGVLALNPDLLTKLSAGGGVEESPRRGLPPVPRPPRGGAISIREMVFVDVPLGPDPRGRIRTGDPATWERLGEDNIPRTPDMDAFEISRYEITNYQYAEYLEDVGRLSEDREGPTSYWTGLYHGKYVYPAPKELEVPVRGVTFEEAQAFAAWLGRRLQARIRLPYWYEWEKAARGPEGVVYPWGDEWSENPTNPGLVRSNTEERGFGIPVEGSRFGYDLPESGLPEGVPDLRDVSPYGAFNMAGNVSEWVDSASGIKYAMGGAYDGDRSYARTWDKTPYPANYRLYFVGFRVVREKD
jgi:formylglycine-generating enzyme required for sulfatase activity